MIKISRKIYLLGVLAILFKVFIASFIYINLFSQKNIEDRVIIIPKSCSIKCTSGILLEAGIIRNKLFFISYARSFGLLGKRIVAGEYEIPKGANLVEIFDKISNGRVVTHQFTIPEGLTNFQIFEILRNQHGVINDEAELNKYKEGEFYPNTYNYLYNTKISELLNTMNLKMKSIISEEWEKRDVANTEELSSPFDALILASIVEKEAKLDEEKPYIAGAYLTRLKRKIPLQADPTVIYGISGKGNFSRKVTYADLKFDSPYNTYLYAGLPPTPICNPGKSSILAVLHSVQTNDIYFVADGSGKHIFASSYKQHLQNIEKIRSK
jgi:UPF0755 protein